jgi:hypothetical protein
MKKVLATAAAVKHARRYTEDVEFSRSRPATITISLPCFGGGHPGRRDGREYSDTVGYAIPEEFGRLIDSTVASPDRHVGDQRSVITFGIGGG